MNELRPRILISLKRLSVTAAAAVILGSVFAMGCGSRPGNNAGSASAASNTNSPRTNIEELGLLINEPYALDDLVWKDFPGQKRIVAVMRVSPTDSPRLVNDAGAFGQPEEVSVPAQPWFPDELIAQAETSGDNMLKGQALPANTFFQDPYNAGRVTHVEGTDFFILDLTGK